VVAATSLLAPHAGATPPETRACDNVAIEDLCTMAGGNEELPQQCAADPAMNATDTGGDEVVRHWEVQAWGFHSCPNSHGDMVRMGGGMQWEFAGVSPFIPRTCSGLSQCVNDSGIYQIDGPPVVLAAVQVATYTVDEPLWANGGSREFIFQ
jgi:hypothetical protein